MARYSYYARGTGNGPNWQVSGEVIEGTFPGAVDVSTSEIFLKLTKGDAVYGHPGVYCQGPYTITMFLITREED